MTTYAVALKNRTTGHEFEKEGIEDREAALDQLKMDLHCYGVVYECVSGKDDRPIAYRPLALAKC